MILLILLSLFMLILPLVIIYFFLYNKEKKQVNQPIPQNQNENNFLFAKYQYLLIEFWLYFLEEQGLGIHQGKDAIGVNEVNNIIAVKCSKNIKDFTGIDEEINGYINFYQTNFREYLEKYLKKIFSEIEKEKQKIAVNNYFYYKNEQSIRYQDEQLPYEIKVSEQGKIQRNIDALKEKNLELQEKISQRTEKVKEQEKLYSDIYNTYNFSNTYYPIFRYNHLPKNKLFVVYFGKR